ncbi:hypothetical protein M2325_000528 [Methanococcus voltae PS]|uniref:Uncharacterized protein n=1 Tax=Methanococcus voltae PS TaxID=523842 RepID=A0ABT2EVI2_METVO|nr:hypothetical protein [Methanococcus voltae]MCS3921855.1 hypothetical protein [Methanococcus voltae PS]
MPSNAMLGLGFLGFGVFAIIIFVFIVGLILELINTFIGLKIVKIDSEFIEILKVSSYKAVTNTILGLLPFGFILAFVVAIYINKTFFDTDWKNGLLIELPLLVLGLVIGLFFMLMMIFSFIAFAY